VLSNIIVISKNLTLKELCELYGSCDAYVSSYRAEGFNMPPLEAAACGIPTILTSGGSTDDYNHPSFVLKIEGKKELTAGNNYIKPNLENLVSNMSALIEKRNSSLKKDEAISFIEKNFILIIELPFNEIKKSNNNGNISKNLNLACLKV